MKITESKDPVLLKAFEAGILKDAITIDSPQQYRSFYQERKVALLPGEEVSAEATEDRIQTMCAAGYISSPAESH
ncbi:MAG: hypothetical protein NMNS02_06410 [Nitrosomonas sp.]|nr:MAG: hypothetical protein NMNS02_06410 [Nitrosomonas sp.]